MALDKSIQKNLKLPAVCAPMTMVSGPEMVAEACKAGLLAVLPTHNARDFEELKSWMDFISDEIKRHNDLHPDQPAGPLAINQARKNISDESIAELELAVKHGVDTFITAMGDPKEKAERIHDLGGKIFHDVTMIRHAEKAIDAGVDGLTCIGAGGGGHSGTISHLAFVPKVREMFDGTIIMAGAITDGAAIRAAEILGADLAYLGTRFIATQESRAPEDYKQWLVSEKARDLLFTPDITGVPANWMKASLISKELDPDNLPVAKKEMYAREHLPEGVRPWYNLFSAGQGIELINDIPTVSELVMRLRKEYVEACETSDMAAAASV